MKYFKIFMLLVLLVIETCIMPMSGGVSDETTNGKLLGSIQDTCGNSIQEATVKLISSGYIPFHDTVRPAVVLTDSSGRYIFSDVVPGNYTVQALHDSGTLGAIAMNINVPPDSFTLEPLNLKKTGSIKINGLNFNHKDTNVVFIPGTDISSPIDDSNSISFLHAIPAGEYPALKIITIDKPASVQTFRENIVVNSNDTTTVEAFLYSREILLNTTVSGANISENIINFPLLVNLTQDNFEFNQSLQNGYDLMFRKQNGLSLHYEIESWDSLNQQAALWVKIDTIYGNSDSQSITMYWGSSLAFPKSSTSEVFDTTDGFQGVWHLGSTQDGKAMDATINNFKGSVKVITHSQGAIGLGSNFNGADGYIVFNNTSTGKLNFPPNGAYSISAWVIPRDTQSAAVIITKGESQYHLKVHNNEWEFAEYNDLSSQNLEVTSSPCSLNTWSFLFAVSNGTSQQLYVNGTLVNSTVVAADEAVLRNDTCNIEIGRRLRHDRTHDSYFTGMIDEVRLSNVARSPAWIKLCYENQRSNGSFLTFK